MTICRKVMNAFALTCITVASYAWAQDDKSYVYLIEGFPASSPSPVPALEYEAIKARFSNDPSLIIRSYRSDGVSREDTSRTLRQDLRAQPKGAPVDVFAWSRGVELVNTFMDEGIYMNFVLTVDGVKEVITSTGLQWVPIQLNFADANAQSTVGTNLNLLTTTPFGLRGTSHKVGEGGKYKEARFPDPTLALLSDPTLARLFHPAFLSYLQDGFDIVGWFVRHSTQDFRFGSSDGTSLHSHPAKHNPFLHPKEAAAEAGPIEPPSCPSWGLIRRCEVNFADTPPSFRPQYTDFAFAKCGATRPAQAAPRSSAACRQTAAGPDVPPRTRASNTARA